MSSRPRGAGVKPKKKKTDIWGDPTGGFTSKPKPAKPPPKPRPPRAPVSIPSVTGGFVPTPATEQEVRPYRKREREREQSRHSTTVYPTLPEHPLTPGAFSRASEQRREAALHKRLDRGKRYDLLKLNPSRADLGAGYLDLFNQTSKDLTQAALNIPLGVSTLASATALDLWDYGHGRKPDRLLQQVLIPAAKGLQQTARHPLEHPGDTLLLGWGGASALARGGNALKVLPDVEKTSFLNLNGEQVQTFASPSYLTRSLQQRRNRGLETKAGRQGDEPGGYLSPRSRLERKVGRTFTAASQRELARVQEQAIEFDLAARKLTRDEGPAYVTFARYGDKAPELLEAEISKRLRKIEKLRNEPPRSGRSRRKTPVAVEIAAQEAMIAKLESGRAHVLSPRPELSRAVDLGRELEAATRAMKIDARWLLAQTAELRVDLPARIVTGKQKNFVRDGDTVGFRTEARPRQATDFQMRLIENLAAQQQIARAIERGEMDNAPPGSVQKEVNRLIAERESLIAERDLTESGSPSLLLEPEPPGIEPYTRTTGEGAFHFKDTSKPTLKSVMSRQKSLRGKQRRQVFESRGTLFEQGRTRMDPKVTSEDFHETARATQRVRDVERLIPFGKPAPDGVAQPGYVLLNPDGVRLAHWTKDDLDSMVLSPRDFATAKRAMLAKVFPDNVDDIPADQRGRLIQVPEQLYDKIEAGSHWSGPPAVPLQVIDAVNSLMKTGFVYAKGSYITLNAASNEALALVKQGAWHLPNLLKSVGVLGDFSPASRRWMDIRAGGGGAVALASEGRGVVQRGERKLADLNQAGADKIPRRTAVVHELRRHKITNEAQLQAFRAKVEAGDKKATAALNQLEQAAQESMVRFGGLSATERAWLQRIIFVYPWIKGATRYQGRLVLDMPVRAALLEQFGQQGLEQFERRLGRIASYLDGIVPIGKPERKLGTTIQKIRNPVSVTPLSTGADVAESVRAGIAGGGARRSLPANFLAPPLKALAGASLGVDPFTGFRVPEGQSFQRTLLTQLAGDPFEGGFNFPIAKTVQIARQDKQTEPFTGHPSKQDLFSREGGLLDALEHGLLGSFRERELNVLAAQARGDKEYAAGLGGPEKIRFRQKKELVRQLQQIDSDERWLLKAGYKPDAEFLGWKKAAIADQRWITQVHIALEDAREAKQRQTGNSDAQQTQREQLELLLPFALAKAPDDDYREWFRALAERGKEGEYEADRAYRTIYDASTKKWKSWSKAAPNDRTKEYKRRQEAKAGAR